MNMNWSTYSITELEEAILATEKKLSNQESIDKTSLKDDIRAFIYRLDFPYDGVIHTAFVKVVAVIDCWCPKDLGILQLLDEYFIGQLVFSRLEETKSEIVSLLYGRESPPYCELQRQTLYDLQHLTFEVVRNRADNC